MGEVVKWAVIKKDNRVENLVFDWQKPETVTFKSVLDKCCHEPDEYKTLIKDGEIYIKNFAQMLHDYNEEHRDIAAEADKRMARWIEAMSFRRSY